jgi:hypothetical protein
MGALGRMYLFSPDKKHPEHSEHGFANCVSESIAIFKSKYPNTAILYVMMRPDEYLGLKDIEGYQVLRESGFMNNTFMLVMKE